MANNEKAFAFPKDVQDISERIRPTYKDVQTVEVQFHPETGCFKEFVEVEYSALELEATKAGLSLPFSEEDFSKYCTTFIVSRVAWVMGEKTSLILHPADKIICPALLDAVTKNIGHVMETKQGLTLVPTIESKDNVLSKPECEKISFFLASLPNYMGGMGYVKDKTGSWEFMSMQLVENVVMSEVDCHPAYSTLAAIVGPKWLGAVTAPRIRYGDLDMYRSLLWQLTSTRI